MTTKLQSLLEKARMATRGPWNVGFSDGSGKSEAGDGFYITTPSEYPEEGAVNEDVIVSGSGDSFGVPQGVRKPQDAYYIAAANPEYIENLARAVIASRRALEAANMLKLNVPIKKEVVDALATIKALEE